MVRLLRNGNPLPDEILIRPQPGNRMHEAVAVANALKRWINDDPKQCLAKTPAGIILTGHVTGSGNGKKISIGKKTFPLSHATTRQGTILQERCRATAASASREPYWVLNPEAPGDTRYVIRTNRGRLQKLVKFINDSGRDPQSAIYGLQIKEG